MTAKPLVPYYLGRPARVWIAAMSRHSPAERVHKDSGCVYSAIPGQPGIGLADTAENDAGTYSSLGRRGQPVDRPADAKHACRMYAVVATVRLDDPQAAREALASMRLDLVPRAPGFVNAYWLAPVEGIGMSVIVFDSKEHADEALAYPLPPLPGVTPLTVQVREVYASA